MGRLQLLFLALLLVTVASAQDAMAGVGKIFGRCTKEKNTFDCLKRRALEILDGAIKDDSTYVVNEFISIGKDAKVARSLELQSLENATQRSLDDELDKKFHDYLNSRSIKLTIPGDALEGEFYCLLLFEWLEVDGKDCVKVLLD